MIHRRMLYILLIFLEIDASENIIDSTIVKHEPVQLANKSCDFYLKVFSKGGENEIESNIEFRLSKNMLHYKGYLRNGILKSDSLQSQFNEVVLKIKNYKPEYDYNCCSKWLDGYQYLIELWDNADKSKVTIISGDYKMCYYNLCAIFSNLEDIMSEFEGESYKEYLNQMRQNNPFGSKVLENKRDKKGIWSAERNRSKPEK